MKKQTLSYAGSSHQGLVRTRNEDNWFASARQKLFIVADGMGGQVAGQLSSRIAVAFLPKLISLRLKGCRDVTAPVATHLLSSSIVELSHRVRSESKRRLGLAGMGATVVLILIRGNHALVAHLGDSRAYLHRAGKLERLTRDHSIVQILVDAGEINEEAVAIHPAKNQITRFLGMDGEPMPEVRLLQLQGKDRLLLCTDGLTQMVSDCSVHNILMKHPRTSTACQALVEEANCQGGIDNVTVLLIDWAGADTHQESILNV